MNSKLIIPFLFVFSFMVRAFCGLHGSPFCYHNDEHWFFQPAFQMITDGNWDTNWFRIPPLLTLLYRVELSFLQLLAPINLALPHVPWFDNQSILPHQFPALYAGRLMVAAFGSGTVVLIYLTLKRFISDKMAVFFSIFYSILSMTVFYSSYLRAEPLVIFFLTLSMCFLVRFQESEKKSHLWLAGTAFGLACSSKYNAGFFALSATLFLVLERKDWKSAFKNVISYGVASILIFIATIPHIFWKFSRVSYEFMQNVSTYQEGHAGNKGSHLDNFHYYMKNLYPLDRFFVLFWVFVTAAIALPFLWKKMEKRKSTFVTVCIFFVVSYIAFLCQFNYRAERNMIFVYPFIAMVAAMMLAFLMEQKDWRPKVISGLLAIIGILGSGYVGMRELGRYNRPLPQDHVRKWVDQNAAVGSILVREFESPLIDPAKFEVLYTFSASIIKPKALLGMNPDYLILSEFVYNIRKDYKNEYPKKFAEWAWSLPSEFEDDNSEQIPFGVHFKIVNFQKYKADFLEKFKAELEAPDQPNAG